MNAKKGGTKKHGIVYSFFQGFGTLIIYELLEEVLEELIAYSITTVITKAISFLLIVLLTQTTKVGLKMITKALFVMIKPIIKKYTYRDGNDKMEKIKNFFKAIWNNKWTISGAVLCGSADGFTGYSLYQELVALNVMPEWANILVTVVVCLIVAIIGGLAIFGGGAESEKSVILAKIKKFLGVDKVLELLYPAKEEKESELEAEKAKEEAEAEAKRQEAEADKKAKEEAEKAQAVLYAEGFKKAVDCGYTGSLVDYIKSQKR